MRAGLPRLSWLVLAFGISCSLVAWQTLLRSERRVAHAHLHAEVNERMLLITERFDETTTALASLASLSAVLGTVSPEHFRRFAAQAIERRPAIRALSWNPIVRSAERDAFERGLRASAAGSPEIVERSPQGELIRASARDEYVVVAMIEPVATNAAAVGFNVASDPVRREALDRARDSGELAVAAPIELVQARGTRTGALAFLPVYRGGRLPSTVAERREQLQGFFVAVVDLVDLVHSTVATVHQSDLDLELRFDPAHETKPVAYGSEPPGVETHPGPEDDVFTATIAWGGRQMNATFTPGLTYRSGASSWGPLAVLLGGLSLTVLLSVYLRSFLGRTSRIEREVAVRTQELRTANQGLEVEVAQRVEAERRLETYRDELERRVVERTAALETTTEQLRAILDSEPECVKVIDADGMLLDMNPAGLAMIEAESLEQVRGGCIYDRIAPQHRDAFVEFNQRIIAGESGILEFSIVGLQGGRRSVETHAVALHDTAGGPNRHLAITRDVTEKKRADADRRKLEAQLRNAQKLESIGVLAGGVAHDFNNLLQVIIGNNELALEDLGEHPAREPLEASASAAAEAAKLCDQMLAYAGQSRPDTKSISLPELVQSMVDLLRVSHSKKAQLELEFDDGLPWIEGDDAQLRQVVMNLVTNASDAIGDEQGRIDVRVSEHSVRGEDETGEWLGSRPLPGRYVRLEVSDSGCGMNAETLDRIFDPFFTTKFTGRGLGLASVLGIVRSHSGYLEASSEAGIGTSFTILLPVAEDAPAPREADPALTEFRLEGTVLLVDDEEQIRRLGRAMLEGMGLEVLLAADGLEALEIFERCPDEIDVVLLDMTMPRLGGRETCSAMREIRAEVAVVLCSGYADETIDHSGPRTSFLHKPYRRSELGAILEKALNNGVA